MPRIAAVLVVFATAAFCIGFNIVRYPVVWERVAAGGHIPQSDEPAESAEAEGSALSPAGTDQYASSDWSVDAAADEPIVASISGGTDLDESDESWDYAQTEAGTYTEESYGYGYDEYGEDSYDAYDGRDAWDSAASDDAACSDGQCRIGGGTNRKRKNRPWTSHGGEDSFADEAEELEEAWPSSEYGSSSREAADGYSESVDSEPWDADSDLVPVRRPPGSGVRATGPRRPASGAWQVEGERRATDSTVRRLPPTDHVWTPDPNRYGRPVPGDSIPIYPTTGIE